MQDNDAYANDLKGLRENDPEAIQRLWGSYFERLVGLARKMLPSQVRRVTDEEDVALSAFHSLCTGAAAGRFPALSDPDDLWRLLVVITFRKARRAARQRANLKQGGGHVRGESVFINASDKSAPGGMAEMLGAGPTPQFAAEVAEQCEGLLKQLGDEQLRMIALMKMEGYTVDEIAAELSCPRRSIERRLQTIRAAWSAALAERS
jgi:DNA-directed RNA polymerase specialized sigma24 family protein